MYLFCLFWSFRATPVSYGGSQATDPVGTVVTSLCQSHSNTGSKLRLQPTPQLMSEPRQRGIRAASATYATAHSNAGSLTHWARAGIEPATSWFLVGFVNHCATTGTPTMFNFNSIFFIFRSSDLIFFVKSAHSFFPSLIFFFLAKFDKIKRRQRQFHSHGWIF